MFWFFSHLILNLLFFFILNEFNEIQRILRNFSENADRHFVVFDDAKPHGFDATLEMFYRSDVIVAPHEPVIANLLAAKPGTTVIEFHCRGPGYVRQIFRLLSLRLGLRYYASQTTRPMAKSPRCSLEGIDVDVEELQTVLNAIEKYLK